MTDSTEADGSPATAPSTAIAANENASTGSKRKLANLELEIITVDPYYDLTLIVGVPSHRHGQKAFQFAQLPNKLSVIDLRALATLTDKYDLFKIVRVILELKKWFVPYEAEWKKSGASLIHLAHFAEMHQVFGNQDDYEYVVNRIAVESSEIGGFLVEGGKTCKIRLEAPEHILARAREMRRLILSEWVDCIAAAIEMAVKGETDPENNGNPTCKKNLCSIMRCGVLMRGLRVAGYDTNFGTADSMTESVALYWKGFKDIGSDLKPYEPCDKTMGYGRGVHRSSCSFEECFGDFGFMNKADKILKKVLHIDVWRQLQTAEYLQAVAGRADDSPSI